MDKRYFYIFFALLVLMLGGCAVSKRFCESEGNVYCRTRGNFTGRWYDYYERGLSCMEGGCYAAALADFEEAEKRRYRDQRRARTLGMHFIDYFPHREKGLIHYMEERYEDAVAELELSIRQYPSAKAYYYLDRARRKIIQSERQKPSVPILTLKTPVIENEATVFWTRDESITVAGAAVDHQQYISEIAIGGEPVFIESAKKRIDFSKTISLPPGFHPIDVVARNLLGGETKRTIAVHVDRSGPVISLDIPGTDPRIKGFLYDESGEATLFVNGVAVDLPKGKTIPFTLASPSNSTIVHLLARDKLGNETEMELDPFRVTALPQKRLYAYRTLQTIADIETPPGNPQLSDSKPLILLKNWNDHETIYKPFIQLPVEIIGQTVIRQLIVDDQVIPIPQGHRVSISHYLSFSPGRTEIVIRATDAEGDIQSKTIYITRLIPEAFRLEYRYGFSVHAFEAGDAELEQAVVQHHFVEDVLSTQRFRIAVSDDLNQRLTERGFTVPARSPDEQVQSALLGVVYKTGNGIEIAARLVDIETRRTLGMVDAYDETTDRQTLERLGKRLSEKLSRTFPIVEGRVHQIEQSMLVFEPENWTPEKMLIQAHWPLMIYRNITPLDPVRGQDTAIVCLANIEETIEKGKVKAVIDDDNQHLIRETDKVISR